MSVFQNYHPHFLFLILGITELSSLHFSIYVLGLNTHYSACLSLTGSEPHIFLNEWSWVENPSTIRHKSDETSSIQPLWSWQEDDTKKKHSDKGELLRR